MKKFFLKSKMIIINGFMALLSLIVLVFEVLGEVANDHFQELKAMLPQNLFVFVIFLVGVYNIYLRYKINKTSKNHKLTTKVNKKRNKKTP